MRTSHSTPFRLLRAPALIVGLALGLGACGPRGELATQPEASTPTDAATAGTGSPAATPPSPTPGTPATPTPPATPASTNVDSILIRELARIAARQETEKPIYDSLKIEWQRVLDDTTGRYADSLMCDPKQYVGTAKIVGPDGADINFGEHTLRIPSGALAVPTVITAEAPTSLRSLAVFSPHGTRFAASRHPTLELSYKHCKGPLTRAARIAYISAAGAILEWPPSEDFPDLGLVRGIIGHFSNYIVAF
jgi:hypothetical protein